MWKHSVFLFLTAFLYYLNAAVHHNDRDTDLEEIIKRCIETQNILLSEIYELNAFDQNRIVDRLLAGFRENPEEELDLSFFLTPPHSTQIPDCFRKLNELRSIEIVAKFSSNFVKTDLKHPGQYIERFIKSLSYFGNMHKLCLSKIELTTCPAALSELKSLKVLELNHNHLNPRSFDEIELPDLERLYIYDDDHLEEIPSGVFNLSRLKRLSMKSCPLKNIPPAIHRLVNLENLWIGSTRIKNIPIHSFKKLKTLDVGYNEMLENVEIDLVLNPRLETLFLNDCTSLNKFVLNIPERGQKIDTLYFWGSPIYELTVSPNLAFSKIDLFMCDIPQSLPPSCGDQLGWPEVLVLCESNHSAINCEIIGERRVLDRFNLSTFNRFCWKSDIFEFCIVDLEKSGLGKEEFMSLWKRIVDRTGIDTLGSEKSNYESSLLYLRNLYGESVEDSEGTIKFIYVQYKPTMRNLLSALFKAINNSSLDQSMLKKYVESIFRMFQRPQGEQLVYFYHLFKTLSGEGVRFEEFIPNSIAILKDYIFTMTVNLKGCDQGLLDEHKTRAKNIGLIPDNEMINFANDGEYYEKYTLPLFYYKFSPDWFCQIIAEVINLDEELKRQALAFIITIFEDRVEYFEHECVEGSNFAVGINVKGVSALLIRTGWIESNQVENNVL